MDEVQAMGFHNISFPEPEESSLLIVPARPECAQGRQNTDFIIQVLTGMG
jgi:hypothetical protein